MIQCLATGVRRHAIPLTDAQADALLAAVRAYLALPGDGTLVRQRRQLALAPLLPRLRAECERRDTLNRRTTP